ncbi:flagellar assembly protein FliH [Ramlibacter sp. H39-3-26]|uniref:flagellar assembly protein FliH n=1 Tax=Curvibacter soli TaxID=3031331 RepID=UPI0023DC72E8|nr:flagellar assembly protein FliH [Ramlibacter sp. H39-3-26]MDF1484218.1 flagellar assembly protein FliH [Ramlibacter sp. H39-3-26]
MKQPLRPHRFPPLERLASGADGIAGSSHADGFQRGMERGYHDGYASGVDAARAQGHAQGLHDGRAQGLREGRAEAQAAFEELAAPIDAMRTSLAAQQQDFEAALRKEVVDLVAKVARQVIRCELALQPVQILALVDETLATMPPTSQRIEVFMNPGDLQRIKDIAPERVCNWELVPDARLESGECRVKAGHREADAGCSQRLVACMEQINNQLQESPATSGEPTPDTKPEAAPPMHTAADSARQPAVHEEVAQ